MADEETRSVWKIIFDTLTENGFNVYPPATHVGECKSPYIVLKQDGGVQINDYSSERVYYRFMLYVPREQYTFLDEYEKQVKKVLDEQLFPMLMPTGQKENDFYDDNYNAHLRAFLYRNNVRNKHL